MILLVMAEKAEQTHGKQHCCINRLAIQYEIDPLRLLTVGP